ncbi:GH36-type glycosyl hydrolase domain-containing protein [Agarivorans sp. QJM3NY_29]|uniref:GH36-type glycosyl hydrolase domain-containing protein n=1 Tax=unclassified Agarivorans TaxID=2636026 RepID=UPI003D7ED03F
MKYGYFDDQHKEYVVTTPKTPIKWINYVGTLDFGGIVDCSGGALLCSEDPALNRITKYIAQQPASEFKGSTLYVRIRKDGEYLLFSPFYTPTLNELDRYECRVGLSYTRWLAEAHGVRVEVCYFVPPGSKVMLQDIRLTNIGGEALEIDLIPAFEFSHFDALKQLTNADWVPQTMQLKAHQQAGGQVVLEQYAYMKRDSCVNYVTANRPVDSWEGDRRAFLGDNEYGSWANPRALLAPQLSNSECVRGDTMAALMIKLGSLASGQSEQSIVQIGQAASLEDACTSIERYRDTESVAEAFSGLAEFWQDYLSVMQVDTPDTSLNSMLNIHNPRQCHTTKNWSRYLSLYQLGYGARGIGFRDSSQDLLGVMSHMPEQAKPFMERLLSVQKPDGSAMHQYFPMTMEATEGDSREELDRASYYGDDHLWIILTVAQYLKETGNLEFLQQPVSFYQTGIAEAEREQATVLEHLLRGIEFTRSNIGAHGLPLLGFADWNDTVNLPLGAESLFVANLYGKAIIELKEVLSFCGEQDLVTRLDNYYQQMQSQVNQHAWDGEWWLRYFDEQTQALGSTQNQQGKIYANAQSWPVISEFADVSRATMGLDAVKRLLNTERGIKLSWPGYTGYDEKLGGVSTYPPGAKENGGIFLHSNPWVVIAETKLGRADQAYQYYRQINPASRNDDLDCFQSEPYCYPQNVLGDEHPQFGLARNAWLSGTASWMYVAATQYILGIRPEMTGLRIQPCIPDAWPGFKVVRKYRGASYHIEVLRSALTTSQLYLEGEAIVGDLIPEQAPGVYQVRLELAR